jgi:formate hydrogenlyase subunit 6/NADH:ubiquinone oxidoreductase subunit I
MKIGVMLSDLARSLLRRPVTRRYPFERSATPARLRGALRWNPARCTGCGMCVKDCPANAIELITLDKASKRFVLRYHLDRCTFCAQCVRTCNFDCLELSNDRWELAALNKAPFTIDYGDEADIQALLEQRAQRDAQKPAQA